MRCNRIGLTHRASETFGALMVAAGALVLTGAIALLAGCAASQPSAVPDESEATSNSPVEFTEVAKEIGISGVHSEARLPPNCFFSDIFPGPQACTIERMSGGVAVGDFDGDGYDDIYVTNLDGPDSLYRNNGNGTFSDVTESAGLGEFAVRSNGAGFADLTNNGYPDLVVTTIAEDRFYLWINNGDGTFTEQGLERGVALPSDNPRGGYSVAFGDYNNDGWIDIHLTEWLEPNIHVPPPEPHTRLLRNQGSDAPGFFEDVTVPAGVEVGRGVTDTTGLSESMDPVVFAFASAFVDLDGDGWEDLIVAADFGVTQLFWNNGDGTFTEGTEQAGIGTEGNAMGLAIGDVNGNGLPDVFISAIQARSVACDGRPCPDEMDGNRLYLNNGDRTFTENQSEAEVRDGHWGWGAAMLDADNDGNVDIVLTNGIDFELDDEYSRNYRPFRRTPKQFWHNQGDGTFSEVAASAGINVEIPGTGLAVMDTNNNGYLDIIMIHPQAEPTVWRNGGDTGNSWLRVSVAGAGPDNGGSNLDGLGAIVEVVARKGNSPQQRVVGVNSHFLGQSERVAHFGLGSPDKLDGEKIHEVKVTFPATGQQTTVKNVTPNQTLHITELLN